MAFKDNIDYKLSERSLMEINDAIAAADQFIAEKQELRNTI